MKHLIPFALAMSLASCETVRDRAATGVAALVDCEAPNIKAAVVELVPLVSQAIRSWIGNDGKIDTTRLRAAAAGMVGDLPRCALATAVAVMAAPAPSMGATVIAVPLAVPDPGALRLAFEAVRSDWGGASYRTAGGTL